MTLLTLAALAAAAVILAGQLVRAVVAWREHRAARRRAEAMLDRQLAQRGDPPPHVRRLEPDEFGFGPWHG